MKKFNHLKTFESFNANEEFNPFKKEDWKSAGTSVRKGVGFLTPEEEMEAGEELVMNHPMYSKIYQHFLDEDPTKAEEYLKFWGKNPDGKGNPVWNGTKFVDKLKRYAPAGSIGGGN